MVSLSKHERNLNRGQKYWQKCFQYLYSSFEWTRKKFKQRDKYWQITCCQRWNRKTFLCNIRWLYSGRQSVLCDTSCKLRHAKQRNKPGPSGRPKCTKRLHEKCQSTRSMSKRHFCLQTLHEIFIAFDLISNLLYPEGNQQTKGGSFQVNRSLH